MCCKKHDVDAPSGSKEGKLAVKERDKASLLEHFESSRVTAKRQTRTNALVRGLVPLHYKALRQRSSYLVDPASSHMLVSKIKPCMSKYKHLYCETANGSLNQLSFI